MAPLTSLKDAAAHFESHLPELRRRADGILIVGIGGPTAVGKSTLARVFLRVGAANAIKIRVLEGDRWLIPQYRRVPGAVFPDDVYDLERMRRALGDLKAGRPISAPFYIKTGRSTGRISARILKPDRIPEEVEARCRDLRSKVSSRLRADVRTGDIYEEIRPENEIWLFDSELALYDPPLRSCLDIAYGIRASRERRTRHFVSAVASGERYSQLSEDEAVEKLTGFFETDDRLIEPSVDAADFVVDLYDEDAN